MQDGTINKSGAAYDARSGTISAILAGSAGLTETTAGLVTLTGANTYTGGTTIGTAAGARWLLRKAALARPAHHFHGGGILQWLPGNTQDVSGRFSPIASGEVACFDTGTNSSVTLASPISGAGGIDKMLGAAR